MRRIIRARAALLLTLPFFFATHLPAQTPPVTVTPTLVTVSLGQPLYCAAKWIKPTVQVYCYTSSSGHTWDQLIFNSIFPVSTNVTLPYIMPCYANFSAACPQFTGVVWLFKPGPTPGTVSWEVGWNSSNDQKGTFQ